MSTHPIAASPFELHIPRTATADAALADWLIRDLLPASLTAITVADTVEIADTCRQLPALDADTLTRPGKLRTYASAARQATDKTEQELEALLKDGVQEGEPTPAFHKDHPVTAIANRARWRVGPSWAGYWAYRAIGTCCYIARHHGSEDTLIAARHRSYSRLCDVLAQHQQATLRTRITGGTDGTTSESEPS